jgi:hypothetical protein
LLLGGFFFAAAGLRLGACDWRFFLAGGAGWAGFSLSPPPNRRCKNCTTRGCLPSLTVSPRISCQISNQKNFMTPGNTKKKARLQQPGFFF